MSDAPFRVRVLPEHVQRDVAKDGAGLGAVPHAGSDAVLPIGNVQDPVQFVLDACYDSPSPGAICLSLLRAA